MTPILVALLVVSIVLNVRAHVGWHKAIMGWKASNDAWGRTIERFERHLERETE